MADGIYDVESHACRALLYIMLEDQMLEWHVVVYTYIYMYSYIYICIHVTMTVPDFTRTSCISSQGS